MTAFRQLVGAIDRWDWIALPAAAPLLLFWMLRRELWCSRPAAGRASN